MIDQATELRKLVVQALRESAAATEPPPPRLIAVTSGTGGVGATSLAVNLSVALADHGLRVVVVDADLYRSDVARLCGIRETGGSHRTSVRRDIHEVMVRGPAGVQVVPGVCPTGQEKEWNELAQERLLRQFKTLGRHADVVVLDAGGSDPGFILRCCRAADDVLLVTTADLGALRASVARILATHGGQTSDHWRLIVNQCPGPASSEQAFTAIRQACDNASGIVIELLGSVPADRAVSRAAVAGQPFVIEYPDSPAATSLQQIALTLGRADDADSLPAAA